MQRKMSRTTFLMWGGGGCGPCPTWGGSHHADSLQERLCDIVDDDHPQHMMDPMLVARRKIRDQGLNFTGSTDIPHVDLLGYLF